jgi:hypothetical protein
MKILSRGTVFDASNASPSECCCAFTSLVKLSSGKLLCSFKSGPSKLSPQDRVIIMESEDGGRTWGRLYDGFDTTFAGVPGSFSGGYLFEADQDRLLISLHWVDRSDPAKPLSNPVTSGVLPMKYLLAESHDQGRTWSKPAEVSLAPHPGSNPTCEMLRLNDGSLLLAYESWKEWNDVDGDQSASVKLSRDEGKTWSRPITMASDPAKQLYYWDNHVTKQPNTGKLLAAFWTHDTTQGRDTTISLAWGEPDGSQWSEPSRTNVEGQVVSPIFLEDGRLMLVYVHRHDPPSIRAIISDDLGKTWNFVDEIIIHDNCNQNQQGMDKSRTNAEYWNDMTRWTFGHPKVIQRADRQFLVVYYAPASIATSNGRNLTDTDKSTPTSIYWTILG